MADAIHTAVTASLEDRVINHASIYRYVQANTLEKWAKSFYKQLFSINSSKKEIDVPTPRGRSSSPHRNLGRSKSFSPRPSRRYNAD